MAISRRLFPPSNAAPTTLSKNLSKPTACCWWRNAPWKIRGSVSKKHESRRVRPSSISSDSFGNIDSDPRASHCASAISPPIFAPAHPRNRRRQAALPRDVTRYSRRYTKGLSRVRSCFVIRLAERPRLLCKRIPLCLHELSLNSNDLLKILGLAQLACEFGVGGDIFPGIGLHFFN